MIEHQKAAATGEVDRLINNITFDMRSQLCMKPQRHKVSVSLDCSRMAFVLLFCDAPGGIDLRKSKVLGERLFARFEPPRSTDKFTNMFGNEHASHLRKFHGRDCQGNWSATMVDPDVEIRVVWSKKTKTEDTPLGHRTEEKEIVTISHGIDTCVLDHKTIQETMRNEEKNDELFTPFDRTYVEAQAAKRLKVARDKAKCAAIKADNERLKKAVIHERKVADGFKKAWKESAAAYRRLMQKH